MKIRINRAQEFVIGGYMPGPHGIDSIIVGYYQGKDYKSFAALCAELAGLRVRDAVLDGEIVCLDDEGRSQFNTPLRRRGQPAFYAFDLLYLNHRDLRKLQSFRWFRVSFGFVN